MSSPSLSRLRSPHYGAFALALVVAWALLALAALGLRHGPIQHDLARRAASAATAAAGGAGRDIRVTFEGRDATLHGSFADAAALYRARAAVAGVHGTRAVSVGADARVAVARPSAPGNPHLAAAAPGTSAPGTSAPGTSAPGTPPPGTAAPGAPDPAVPAVPAGPAARPLTVAVDGSGLTVSATVADLAARRALLAAAADASSGRLVGDVQVTAGVGAPANGAVSGLARALSGRDGRYRATLALDAGAGTAASRTAGSWTVVVAGTAPSAAERSAVDAAVLAAARQAVPDVTLRDTVAVEAPQRGSGAPSDAGASTAASIAALRAAIAAGPVRFASGSATLTAADRQRLDRIAAVLRTAGRGVGVEVDGHADATGTPRGNDVLSRARADGAADYLRGLGVERDRVRTAAYGADRPVASDSTAAGRAANRRVEFVTLRLP
jgi:outer membrane protein OmpA-like peptidoglycan-associated protein